MSYQTGTGRFSLHFAKDDGDVGVVADGLAFLEYPYNILACLSWYADGNLSDDDLGEMERSLLAREVFGVTRVNCSLRHLLPRGASLTVVSLQMTSPLQGEFKGIADAIRALVDLLDPIKWADKSEDLKHKRVMNRQKERQEFIKTQTQSLAGAEKAVGSMTSLVTLKRRFEQALKRDMEPEEARAYADAVTRELLAATAAGLRGNVEVKALPRMSNNKMQQTSHG